MAYTLKPNANDPDAAEQPLDDSGEFAVSAQPVIAEKPIDAEDSLQREQLPRSYGSQMLWLVARDPQTLFACWDVDWTKAFAGDPPRDRKVHLRVRTDEGVEETSMAIEPMAGSCYVQVRASDKAYISEIGYFQPADVWNAVATSQSVTTPPDATAFAEPEFATIPFHLSFQRIMETLQLSKNDERPLTARLAEIRERSSGVAESSESTAAERELVQALHSAEKTSGQMTAAQPPVEEARANPAPDLWARLARNKFRSGAQGSPSRGFGGSSRPR